MCEIVYNILITNFTVHRCIIRSNAPSNLQMQPLGCIFVYALNCITFGTAIELACGYGGSIGAIKAMGGTELKLSDDDLFKLVDDWRSSSPNIVKFWGDVQRAAEKVITDQCGMTCGKLRFSYESGIFFIELPSRRRLAYVRPKVEKDDNGKNIITYEGIDNSHKWNRLKTYGVKLVENITQGVARDLLLYAMQNMQDMEIVGHVHDEVIIECTPDRSGNDRAAGAGSGAKENGCRSDRFDGGIRSHRNPGNLSR